MNKRVYRIPCFYVVGDELEDADFDATPSYLTSSVLPSNPTSSILPSNVPSDAVPVGANVDEYGLPLNA